MPVLENYAVVSKENQKESLYFNKYPHWVNPETGRIHPSIRNSATSTRRPAGNSPNLLQVSKGDIRTLFPAGDGRVFISSDFAGQEIVLTSCATKDPVLLDAFMQTPRKDVHALTASGIAWRILPRLGVPCAPGPMPYEDFLAGLHSEDPKIAKAYATVRGNKYAKPLIFQAIYGGTPIAVAETLQIPKEDAEQLLNSLFDLYKRIPLWQQEVAELARKQGYVQMPFGSRRHATKDLWSGDRKLEGRQDRQLSNSKIQSCGAEILKVVRQEMFGRKMRERYQLESIFPIYDEITASVPVEFAEDYCMELAEVMRVTPPGYPVGLEIEASIGLTWGSQIEVGIPTREKVQSVLNELRTKQESQQ
jgi:DNA polymerase-1